ncbi:M3 family metallopeptidase [Escherichia coli]
MADLAADTTQQPALAEMRDRATREKLFIAGWTRAEKNDGNDTRAIIQRLVEIRAQQATLLGFPHYATKIADARWQKHLKQRSTLCGNCSSGASTCER